MCDTLRTHRLLISAPILSMMLPMTDSRSLFAQAFGLTQRQADAAEHASSIISRMGATVMAHEARHQPGAHFPACPNCGGPEGYPSAHAVGCPYRRRAAVASPLRTYALNRIGGRRMFVASRSFRAVIERARAMARTDGRLVIIHACLPDSHESDYSAGFTIVYCDASPMDRIPGVIFVRGNARNFIRF